MTLCQVHSKWNQIECSLPVVMWRMVSFCPGTWGQPWEDDTGWRSDGGHLHLAGSGLRGHPRLHHQPGVRCFALPAGQGHTLAFACAQMDHHRNRPLHHPFHYQTYRQVSVLVFVCFYVVMCVSVTEQMHGLSEREII